MNRIIKFRGKTFKGKWIYGYYYFSINEHKILCVEDSDKNGEHAIVYVVEPSTIGQFTGLFDMNKKEIYEGDIAKYDDYFGIVRFDFAWFIRYENHGHDMPQDYCDRIEVTGNIHENN